MRASVVVAEVISVAVLLSFLPGGLVNGDAIGQGFSPRVDHAALHGLKHHDTRATQGEGLEAAHFQPYKWDYGYGPPNDGSQTTRSADEDEQQTSEASSTDSFETGSATNHTSASSESISASTASDGGADEWFSVTDTSEVGLETSADFGDDPATSLPGNSTAASEDEYPEETSDEAGDALSSEYSSSSGSTTSDVLATLISASGEASSAPGSSAEGDEGNRPLTPTTVDDMDATMRERSGHDPGTNATVSTVSGGSTGPPFVNATATDAPTISEEPTYSVNQTGADTPATPSVGSIDPAEPSSADPIDSGDSTWSPQNATGTPLSDTGNQTSSSDFANTASAPPDAENSTASSLASPVDVPETTTLFSSTAPYPTRNSTTLGEPTPESSVPVSDAVGTNGTTPDSDPSLEGSLDIATAPPTPAINATGPDLGSPLPTADPTPANASSPSSEVPPPPFPSANGTAVSSSATADVDGAPFTVPSNETETSSAEADDTRTTTPSNATAIPNNTTAGDGSPITPSPLPPTSLLSTDMPFTNSTGPAPRPASETSPPFPAPPNTTSSALPGPGSAATSLSLNTTAEPGPATEHPPSSPPYPVSNGTFGSVIPPGTGVSSAPDTTLQTSEPPRPDTTASGNDSSPYPLPTSEEAPRPFPNTTSLGPVGTGSVTVPTISQNDTFPGIPPVTDVPLPPVNSSVPSNISSALPDESGSVFRGPPESTGPVSNATDVETIPSTTGALSPPFPATNSTGVPEQTVSQVPSASGDNGTISQSTGPPYTATNATGVLESTHTPATILPSNDTSAASGESGTVVQASSRSGEPTAEEPYPTVANATSPFPSTNVTGLPQVTDTSSLTASSNITSAEPDETGSLFQGPPESPGPTDAEPSLTAGNATSAPFPVTNTTGVPGATGSSVPTAPGANSTSVGPAIPPVSDSNATSGAGQTGAPTIIISDFSTASVVPLPGPTGPNATLPDPAGDISPTLIPPTGSIVSRNATGSSHVAEATSTPTILPGGNTTVPSVVSETPMFPNSTGSAEQTGDVYPSVSLSDDTAVSENGTASAQITSTRVSLTASPVFPNTTAPASQTDAVSPSLFSSIETAVPSNISASAQATGFPSGAGATVSEDATSSLIVSPSLSNTTSAVEDKTVPSTTTVITGPVSNVTVTAPPSTTTTVCITLTVTHGNVTEIITKTLTEPHPDATMTEAATDSAINGETTVSDILPFPGEESASSSDGESKATGPESTTSCDTTTDEEAIPTETTCTSSLWPWLTETLSLTGTAVGVSSTSEASGSETSADHEASVTLSGLASTSGPDFESTDAGSALSSLATTEVPSAASNSTSPETSYFGEAVSETSSAQDLSVSAASSDQISEETGTSQPVTSNGTWGSDPTTLLTSTLTGGDGRDDSEGPFYPAKVSPTTTVSDEPLPSTAEYPWGGEGPLHRHHNVSSLGLGSSNKVRVRDSEAKPWSSRWREGVKKLRVLWKGGEAADEGGMVKQKQEQDEWDLKDD